jgi:uncharacterized protein
LVEDIAGHLPLLQRLARTVLPLGLALALPTWLLADGLWQPGGMEVGESIGGILRAASALILACGYACAIVVVFQHGPGRRFFGLFRPVGQMALTNYLVQGFAYGLVLTGVGPGLGLAGKIGNAHVLAICVAFFAAQIAVSHWWLARYRFGPMEWLWRWLTYGGAMPSMRVER